MRTKLVIISLSMFLLCSSISFSQQSYSVSIPGTKKATYYSETLGYGFAGDGHLFVGRTTNNAVLRSYITWSNISNYIPPGAEITEVKFSITWVGNASAQIEFLDFEYVTGDAQQIWSNIGSGILWDTEPATTIIYTFPELTNWVMNILNGSGVDPIRVGVKNQNESSSDFYVYYSGGVNLTIDYTITTNVTQVDDQGDPFGQVGLWLSNNWNYINVPFGIDLQQGSNLGLQSDTNLTESTYQKYFRWAQNSEVSYTNHHKFIIQSGVNDIVSTFNPSYEITISNSLEGTTLDSGEVEFADPWLIDYPDPEYGNTKRNRGMKLDGEDALIFYPRDSPFYPDYDTYYKGVFLDQGSPNWAPPYYKVGMPTEQTFSINGQNRKFVLYKWQNDGGVTFQDEYARQTGVVFTSSNATATAVLKGQLMSSDQYGVKNPSQRKIVRTDNGQYHVVYESMGTVFYTYSLTSDFYGDWSKDCDLAEGNGTAKNPAIDYEGNEVKIVFEYYDPQVGGNATIQLVTYGTSGGGTYEQIDYEEVTTYPNSYYGNAKPVISYSQYEIFIAYRIGPTGGIKEKTKFYSLGSWDWDIENDIPGTNSNCINSSVTGFFQPGNVGFVFIAYENSGIIYFRSAPRFFEWDWDYFDPSLINLSKDCGFNLNKYPVISLSGNSTNQYLVVSWLGIYNGTPTNPLPKTDGTKPLHREAAVVKTATVYGHTINWSTPSSFNNNVDYTSNSSLNTTYGSIMAWSESDGQYSKFVRRRNALGYDAITPLSTNGIHTLISNGSDFGNVKAMVFNNSNEAPYFLNQCTNDFTYIPDGMEKLSESGIVDISYGRSGIVEKNGIEFVFNIGDVLLNGETIKFIERVDTLPVASIEELNLSLRTDTLNLTSQSELIFSDYYYVVFGEKADSLLSNEFNVNFKCELVKLSNEEVAGVFEEVNYNKSNLKEYGIEGYLIDCSGIETGDYYLRLTTSVNEEVGLSLSDIQMDNVVLEKSNLNIRNFKGSSIPLEYSLEQNYPNPFNPTTTIRYQIPKDGMVTLKVYDILGAEVASLVNEEKIAGKYEISFNARNLASGVYIYRLNANDFVNVKKMVLLK